jgi:integrase
VFRVGQSPRAHKYGRAKDYLPDKLPLVRMPRRLRRRAARVHGKGGNTRIVPITASSRILRAVQALLGHSSIATTERCTAVNDDEVRAAAIAATLIDSHSPGYSGGGPPASAHGGRITARLKARPKAVTRSEPF